MSTVLRQTFRLARSTGITGQSLKPVSKWVPKGGAYARQTGMLARGVNTKAGRDGEVDMEDVEAMAEEDGDDEADRVENLLKGKKTRDNMRTAFKARSADAMRYEYMAQRADVESETDAAMTFRGLSESARQQSLGYLELMEEYGDVDFGSTLENLDVSAVEERARADGSLHNAGVVAGQEEFEEIEDWFEDMSDAGHRAATKLDAIHGIIEGEMMEGTEIGADGDGDADGSQVNMGEPLENIFRGPKK